MSNLRLVKNTEPQQQPTVDELLALLGPDKLNEIDRKAKIMRESFKCPFTVRDYDAFKETLWDFVGHYEQSFFGIDMRTQADREYWKHYAYQTVERNLSYPGGMLAAERNAITGRDGGMIGIIDAVNLVGELKKGTYVYYHCTGNKGHCAEPYTRQERLNEEITRVLSTLLIPSAVIAWLRATIATDDDAKETARVETLRQTQQEHDRITKRLEAMYLDKLDGRITSEFYDQKATEWRQEQATLQERINGLRSPTTGYQAAIDAIQCVFRAMPISVPN